MRAGFAGCLAVSTCVFACVLAACDRDAQGPASGPQISAMRMKFPGVPWLNVEFDSLVVESESDLKSDRTTVTRFNPGLSTVSHEVMGTPGLRVTVRVQFHERDRLVAGSEAEIILGEDPGRVQAAATVQRLPAWDSVIPPLPEPGHLVIEPLRPIFAGDTSATVELRIWNRNPDTLSWSIVSKDPWMSADPGNALVMLPGQDITVALSLDKGLKPSARAEGLLVFSTEAGLDTVRLQYFPTLASGEILVKGWVENALDRSRLDRAEVEFTSAADTTKRRLFTTDHFGEFAWLRPQAGRYALKAQAQDYFLAYDSLDLAPRDTFARIISLLPKPAHKKFDFGMAADAPGPALVVDGKWVVATKGTTGEGVVAIVGPTDPSPGGVRTVPQRNLHPVGGTVMVVQEMAAGPDDIYLSYPSEQYLVHIRNWQDTEEHDRVPLPFAPFGLALDSNRLLVAGADSGSNTLLAVLDAASLAVQKIIPLPGFQSGGFELGVWGPKVAVGPDAYYVVDGGRVNSRGHVGRIDRRSLEFIRGVESDGEMANDVAWTGNGLAVVNAKPGYSSLVFFDSALVKTGKTELTFDGLRIFHSGAGAYNQVGLVLGKAGDQFWFEVRTGRMVHQAAKGPLEIILWDAVNGILVGL